MQNSKLLTKYWLKFNNNAAHPLGVGVTAYNIADAKSLVAEQLFQNGHLPSFQWSVIDSLDELEKNHVLPNIGLISFRGIWFS